MFNGLLGFGFLGGDPDRDSDFRGLGFRVYGSGFLDMSEDLLQWQFCPKPLRSKTMVRSCPSTRYGSFLQKGDLNVDPKMLESLVCEPPKRYP